MKTKYIIEYGNKRGTWSQIIGPKKLIIEFAASFIHTANNTIEDGRTVTNRENNYESDYWKYKKGEIRKIWQSDKFFCAINKLSNDLGPASSVLW